jgi:hypothetical protein
MKFGDWAGPQTRTGPRRGQAPSVQASFLCAIPHQSVNSILLTDVGQHSVEFVHASEIPTCQWCHPLAAAVGGGKHSEEVVSARELSTVTFQPPVVDTRANCCGVASSIV